MGLVIVQLSDLHFSIGKTNNPLLDRGDSLCGAIRSVLSPDDSCIFVLSGDIADRGKDKEYDLSLDFIAKVHAEIATHINKSPAILITPGNHDLDYDVYDFDESIREMIIEQHNPKNPPSAAMEEYCLKPQEPFRTFAQNIFAKLGAYASSAVIDLKEITFEGLSIRCHLLNTTRFSRKTELPGQSWLPIKTLSGHFKSTDEQNVMSIGVLHHPYNWHRPENAAELKRLLESNCDIVLTGHEHNADQFSKVRRSTEQNLYVEGGVLQDHDDAGNSSFNVVRIEPEHQSFLCTTFSWTGTSYDALTEPYEHKYLRLRHPLRNQFEVQEEWLTWLEQVGTDFRHPRCKELKLSDIFVYPDLQRLNVKNACSPTGTVRDRDVLGFIQEKKRLFIAGAEKIGKTSLSKQLFTDLRESGFVPVLIRSDFEVEKVKSATDVDSRMRRSVDKVLSKIYADDSAKKFWYTKTAERALIVDDYQRLRVGTGGRDELVKWFDANFGIVILVSTHGLRMTDILNRTEDDTLLWTFEHADIFESDAESRHQLVRKWLLAGTNQYQVSLDEIYKSTVRSEQIVDALIGQGAIPSLPMFVQMMMQQVETRGNVESSTGLYGSLYELIIRDVVKGASSDPADIEVKLNYLSELAFALFSAKKRSFDEAEFNNWHDGYCSAYLCRLNSEKTVFQFESIGVFKKIESEVGFKYRYYYCFFLARYLASKMHEDNAMKIIEHLSSTLHNNDDANVMLFLCHLSRDPRILRLIIDKVRSHFKTASEYDLAASPSIIPAHPIRPEHLALPSSSLEEERLKDLRQRDDIQRPNGLEAFMKSEAKPKLDEVMVIINEASSALHSIRICGQVIRNFYGGMKGDEQIDVINECYGICLRMISVLFEFLEKDKEELAAGVAEILKHRYPKMDDQDVDKNVRRSLQTLALSISYGMIKHTSNSLGLAALKPTFDKLLTAEGITLSHRMLDISTRLDYFDKFPEKLVLKIAEELDEGIIGHEVLRILVWEHFKLFGGDYQLRQSLCKALNIDATQPALISSKERKLLS